MKYHSVRFITCDFCGKIKDVVTEVDDFYICLDCAKEILKHCIKNEKFYKAKEQQEWQDF